MESRVYVEIGHDKEGIQHIPYRKIESKYSVKVSLKTESLFVSLRSIASWGRKPLVAKIYFIKNRQIVLSYG